MRFQASSSYNLELVLVFASQSCFELSVSKKIKMYITVTRQISILNIQTTALCALYRRAPGKVVFKDETVGC